MKNPYLKYKNKNKSCSYPFEPDGVGYCWTYANHVDGTKGFENLNKCCYGCEMFKPGKKKMKKSK